LKYNANQGKKGGLVVTRIKYCLFNFLIIWKEYSTNFTHELKRVKIFFLKKLGPLKKIKSLDLTSIFSPDISKTLNPLEINPFTKSDNGPRNWLIIITWLFNIIFNYKGMKD